MRCGISHCSRRDDVKCYNSALDSPCSLDVGYIYQRNFPLPAYTLKGKSLPHDLKKISSYKILNLFTLLAFHVFM